MDFPGLDTKKMTDDELLRRISELHGKLLGAYAMGMAPELMNQIQAILETLEFEQSERSAKRYWDLQQKRAPQVIETEPDLIEKKEAVQTTKTKVRTGVGGGGLLKRTKTPSSDQP